MILLGPTCGPDDSPWPHHQHPMILLGPPTAPVQPPPTDSATMRAFEHALRNAGSPALHLGRPLCSLCAHAFECDSPPAPACIAPSLLPTLTNALCTRLSLVPRFAWLVPPASLRHWASGCSSRCYHLCACRLSFPPVRSWDIATSVRQGVLLFTTCLIGGNASAPSANGPLFMLQGTQSAWESG